jgi:hypothetical protein
MEAGEENSEHSPHHAATHKHHCRSQHQPPHQTKLSEKTLKMQPTNAALVHTPRYLKAASPTRERRQNTAATQTEALGFHPR